MMARTSYVGALTRGRQSGLRVTTAATASNSVNAENPLQLDIGAILDDIEVTEERVVRSDYESTALNAEGVTNGHSTRVAKVRKSFEEVLGDIGKFNE